MYRPVFAFPTATVFCLSLCVSAATAQQPVIPAGRSADPVADPLGDGERPFLPPEGTATPEALGRELAARLATTLGPSLAEGLAAGGVLLSLDDGVEPATVSDRSPTAERLDLRIVHALGAALVERCPRATIAYGVTSPPQLAPARGFSIDVHILTARRGRHLITNATVAHTLRPGWRHLSRVSGPATMTFSFPTPIDGHLSAFGGYALPLLGSTDVTSERLRLPARNYVALTATDQNRDGVIELYFARPDAVDAVTIVPGRRVGHRLHRIGTVALPPVAASDSPARRTIGTALALPDRVVFHLSTRPASFGVTWAGGVLAVGDSGPDACAPEDFPMGSACATRVAGRDYFAAQLRPRLLGSTQRPAAAGFYARSLLTMRTRDGSERTVEAIVTPGGRLSVRMDGQAMGDAPHGAALAVADLDADGQPELLLSAPTEPPGRDELRLLRATTNGGLARVWTSAPTAGSVVIAAALDADGDGHEEFLAIEEPPNGDETPAHLWIVR